MSAPTLDTPAREALAFSARCVPPMVVCWPLTKL